MHAYGYGEMRTPLIERTSLFKRSIGEATDIVEKEMYTFEDRKGESLTLRPENTASCVRAAIENGLLQPGSVHRLWYTGPMFRYERPQLGRQRQFFQAARFRKALVSYFSERMDELDEDSKRRLELNPLRILDSKNPSMQAMIEAAPKLKDSLSDSSKAHFETVCQLLRDNGLEPVENPRLVRGLDYYSHTVFEWTTDKLGSQSAVCAGGRYDGLLEQMGASSVPGVGWAFGLERVVALLDVLDLAGEPERPDVFVIASDDVPAAAGLNLAELARDLLPEGSILYNAGQGSLKSQFRKADKSGASLALVLGKEELTDGTVTLKPLRGGDAQQNVPRSELSQASYWRELQADQQ